MIVLCHAVDDSEVMFIRALLQSADITFHIVGENFGSLFPGLQIPSYNERRFLVNKEDAERAFELLREHRQDYVSVSTNLDAKSKWRIVLETLFLGWSVPSGTKKNSSE